MSQADLHDKTALDDQDVLLIEQSESPGQAAEWIAARRGITFGQALALATEWMDVQEH